MKILFKCDLYLYYRGGYGLILFEPLDNYEVEHVKHLDELEILYYYRDTHNDNMLPIYYDGGFSFITKIKNKYQVYDNYGYFVRDNTIPNLMLLDNGAI